MPATPVWLAAVEAALNRGVQSSARAETLAARLHGTAVRIDIEGIAPIRAGVSGGKLMLAAAGSADAEPAATISGSPLALLNLALGSEGGGRAAASAGIAVHDDAEIASAYQKLIAAARPDLEEELSRLVGDLPARRLSLFARRAAGWARSAGRTALENVAEYLQEEGRDVVGRHELDEFLEGVDRAREAADRIEARVARLERRQRGVL